MLDDGTITNRSVEGYNVPERYVTAVEHVRAAYDEGRSMRPHDCWTLTFKERKDKRSSEGGRRRVTRTAPMGLVYDAARGELVHVTNLVMQWEGIPMAPRETPRRTCKTKGCFNPAHLSMETTGGVKGDGQSIAGRLSTEVRLKLKDMVLGGATVEEMSKLVPRRTAHRWLGNLVDGHGVYNARFRGWQRGLAGSSVNYYSRAGVRLASAFEWGRRMAFVQRVTLKRVRDARRMRPGYAVELVHLALLAQYLNCERDAHYDEWNPTPQVEEVVARTSASPPAVPLFERFIWEHEAPWGEEFEGIDPATLEYLAEMEGVVRDAGLDPAMLKRVRRSAVLYAWSEVRGDYLKELPPQDEVYRWLLSMGLLRTLDRDDRDALVERWPERRDEMPFRV